MENIANIQKQSRCWTNLQIRIPFHWNRNIASMITIFFLIRKCQKPEATFPDKQNADAGYLITQLHPVAGWPLTSGIHVNKSQHQEKHEETADVLDYNYLQTIPPPKPSWDSDYSPGDYDDFLCPWPVSIDKCISDKCEIGKEHENPIRLVDSGK